jgi:hypothetical protein
MDDILMEFALARVNAWPPPHEAWHVAWPVRPRRLVSPVAVSPTGATYVGVDTAGAPKGSRLRLEMEWEDYARMRWSVLKLDSADNAIASIAVTSPDLATRAAVTVDMLDATRRIVVVGVNLGSTEHPFSPSQGQWEPHGWMVTLEGLTSDADGP